MCDFGFLSRGHALTKSGNLSDESKKNVNNLHKYISKYHIYIVYERKIVFAKTNMLLCMIMIMILSWGHALTNSDILSDESKKDVKSYKNVSKYHIYFVLWMKNSV
jgi:hypothetical protein